MDYIQNLSGFGDVTSC